MATAWDVRLKVLLSPMLGKIPVIDPFKESVVSLPVTRIALAVLRPLEMEEVESFVNS